jgi:FtsH-binding integral membrane protein
MMPSLFSLAQPPSAFQVWFVVYVYLLPILLYAAWASLSLMDLMESSEGGWPMLFFVMLVPLVGGAWYLLMRARTLSRSARVATVVTGTVAWLVPLLLAIWLVGRPLGPKALS